MPTGEGERAMRKAMYTVHTDGACLSNPGPGGWGAVIEGPDGRKELSGQSSGTTTNNRMELMGAISALRATPVQATVKVITDSMYVKDGICSWITSWRRNSWRTSSGKAVKNQDLWQALDEAVSERRVSWAWVRGHAGSEDNERADRLANEAATRCARGEPESNATSVRRAAAPSDAQAPPERGVTWVGRIATPIDAQALMRWVAGLPKEAVIVGDGDLKAHISVEDGTRT